MTAVLIERIAAGGAGVGRLADGMAIFVQRTAPGDLADVTVTRRKVRYAEGHLVRLERPGPDRVTPRCRHYADDHCGGCQLQHLSPEIQREVKQVIVGEALRRIGRRDVPNPKVVAAPCGWRYRTKITLAAQEDRLGLHSYDRAGAIFQLVECPITSERLMEVWRVLSQHPQLLPPHLDSLVLREDRTKRVHVVVGGGASPEWDARPLARVLADPEVSIWWRPARGAARVLIGPEMGFPPLAFQQINQTLADRIRAEAVEAVGPVEGRVVWDLYGGVGDSAQLLAGRGASVWMVERDRTAVAWARRHVETSAAGRVRCVVALVEEALHRLPEPDAIVANPPRRGLHRHVASWLDRWAAGRPGVPLVYVSCDPATLARDIARMPSFRIREVTAYDLFPQTSHVETLVALEAR
jgi:23S rRNA (uracil1939-C5)-methyltransferase